MPIRGEEIRVTEDDVTATARPSDNGRAAGQRSMDALRAAFMQKIFSFIQSASVEELAQIRQAIDRRDPPGRANMGHRAVLSLYLNLTPWLILFPVVMIPAMLGGWFYQLFRREFQFAVPLGNSYELCPPSCNWLDIVVWGTAVGGGLLLWLLFSHLLRKRLNKANKRADVRQPSN
jgi:hypothetical protein